jgi:hypothetical protein
MLARRREGDLGDGRFEQLNWVPGRIIEQNLFATNAYDDLVAEVHSFLA